MTKTGFYCFVLQNKAQSNGHLYNYGHKNSTIHFLSCKIVKSLKL